jgi:hypothetical protein
MIARRRETRDLLGLAEDAHVVAVLRRVLLRAALKVFFRFPAAPSFFSGVAPSGAGSAFAINHICH